LIARIVGVDRPLDRDQHLLHPPRIAPLGLRREPWITIRANALGLDRAPKFIISERSKLLVAQFIQLLSRKSSLGHCCLLLQIHD
jgi:hypothetical protein